MVIPEKQVLVSSSFLGPVSYFASIGGSASIFIDQHENYIKQTYRNRCLIATTNGPLPLTIPVIKTLGNHTPMKDIRIAYYEKWQQLHWRAILSAYSNSPFFLYYRDELEPFYQKQFPFLIDFNEQLMQLCFNWLRLKIQVIRTENFIPAKSEGILDKRNIFSPKILSKASFPKYSQVFDDQFGFLPDLSILDLLFNMGPESETYLQSIGIKD